jgi:hypothetical protein
MVNGPNSFLAGVPAFSSGNNRGVIIGVHFLFRDYRRLLTFSIQGIAAVLFESNELIRTMKQSYQHNALPPNPILSNLMIPKPPSVP